MAPSINVADSHDEALEHRRDVANTWIHVRRCLARRIKSLSRQRKGIPKELVDMLKVASDQIRLDFRLDPPQELPAAEPVDELPAIDPLDEIRLVPSDAA